MAKASKYKKNTTDQEIENNVDLSTSTDQVIEVTQEVLPEASIEVQKVQEAPIVEPVTDIAEPVVNVVEPTVIEEKTEPFVEAVAPVVEVEQVKQEEQPIVAAVVEVKQEEPAIRTRKLGKLIVAESFIQSTPTFFTWLHKQGYAILHRDSDNKGNVTFLLEGGTIDPISSGEPPIYTVNIGNYISIKRK